MTSSPFQRKFGTTDAPLALGDVTVIRSFFFTTTDVLVGFRNARWYVKGNRALCLVQQPHEPCTPLPATTDVHMGCQCGFYGYWTARHMAQNHPKPLFTRRSVWDRRLYGVIRGYGTVVMGPYGVRAAKADLVALAVRKGHMASNELAYTKDRISRLYGDVPVYQDIGEMLGAHPLTPRPDDIPEPPPDPLTVALRELGGAARMIAGRLGAAAVAALGPARDPVTGVALPQQKNTPQQGETQP